MNHRRRIAKCLVFCFLIGLIQPAMAVQYIGYYGDTSTQANPRTNTAFQEWTGNAATTVAAINAIASGDCVLLDVSALFFTGTALNTTTYPTNWADLVAALASVPSGKVVAFYLFDEPNINGASVANLTTAISALHKSFPYPGTAVMTAFSPSAAWDKSMVQLYDWVGFDCYTNGTLTCTSSSNGTSGAYINTYNSLKSQIRSGAHMFLIPQVSQPSDECCVGALEQENQYMLQLAYSDPTVVAIFGFYWPNCPTCGASFALGLTSLPSLWPTLNQVGNTVEFLRQYALGWRYPAGTAAIFLNGTGIDGPTDAAYFVWSSGTPTSGLYMSGLAFFLYSNAQSGTLSVYDCTVARSAKGGGPFIATVLSSTDSCAAAGGGAPQLLGYALTSSVSGSTPISVYTAPGTQITLYAPPVTIP
jgi:hypothetical protein